MKMRISSDVGRVTAMNVALTFTLSSQRANFSSNSMIT